MRGLDLYKDVFSMGLIAATRNNSTNKLIKEGLTNRRDKIIITITVINIIGISKEADFLRCTGSLKSYTTQPPR